MATTNYGLIKPGIGGPGWGENFGQNFDVIDKEMFRIAGIVGAGTSSDVATTGHITATGTAPALTIGAAAGTTPPTPTVTGNDDRGVVKTGSGTSPATGTLMTVTFATAYGVAPIVVLTPANAATQALGVYIVSISTTTFVIGVAVAPTASQAATVYQINYAVIG